MNWQDLVDRPARQHFVQVYQDAEFLAEAVTRYLQAGLDAGEAGIVIARPENRARFAVRGAVTMLDAEETLGTFMANGMPQWAPFRDRVGGLIGAQGRTVRAYGEMVDILWQRGEREAATRLEEYWNELGGLHEFSLFCAYYMDPLESASYDGALQCVCKTHSHLIPARDYAGFDKAVADASRNVLEGPLARMLFALSGMTRNMPVGQAALFWLKQNMPRAAEKILSELRASASRAG